MAFLRELRLAIERRWEREENWWAKTWQRCNQMQADFISFFYPNLEEQKGTKKNIRLILKSPISLQITGYRNPFQLWWRQYVVNPVYSSLLLSTWSNADCNRWYIIRHYISPFCYYPFDFYPWLAQKIHLSFPLSTTRATPYDTNKICLPSSFRFPFSASPTETETHWLVYHANHFQELISNIRKGQTHVRTKTI